MNSAKMMRNTLMLSAAILMAVTGCRKDKDETDTDTGSALDNSFAEATYNDAATIADQAAINGTVTTYRNSSDGPELLSTCATVTHDSTAVPKVVTIDFGTANCLCLDNRYRRGKIIVTYTGAYRDSGMTHTISFDNYYVNDYHIEGTKTVTNMGTNTSGNVWFDIDVTGTITATTGQVLTWTSSRVREWISGYNTQIWSDDVYEITGSASGTSFTGNSFTATILSPLVIALDCRWIKDGTLEFSPSGKLKRTIDYGYPGGGCDKYAQVTIGNGTYVIELR